MKKFLRALLILIVILAVFIGIRLAMAPKTVTVQRSTIIKAPRSAVFAQMTHFKNWPNWNPWYEIDPKMAMTYIGTDGEVRSGYHWVGTKEKETGEGEITTTGLNGDTMKYHLSFMKPWKSEADGYLIAKDNGNGTTEATWVFTMPNKFPGSLFTLFMDMDKALGKDFSRGLELLKNYTESHPDTTVIGSTTTITETKFPLHIYAGIRQEVKWDDMHQFFMTSFDKIGKIAGNSITGPAAAIYYKWDTENKKADMAAVMPVANEMTADGITSIRIEESKAYMAVHKGGYSSIGQEHDALHAKLESAGKKEKLVIEEYVKGSYQDKDSTKWVTNIYYLFD